MYFVYVLCQRSYTCVAFYYPMVSGLGVFLYYMHVYCGSFCFFFSPLSLSLYVCLYFSIGTRESGLFRNNFFLFLLTNMSKHMNVIDLFIFVIILIDFLFMAERWFIHRCMYIAVAALVSWCSIANPFFVPCEFLYSHSTFVCSFRICMCGCGCLFVLFCLNVFINLLFRFRFKFILLYFTISIHLTHHLLYLFYLFTELLG